MSNDVSAAEVVTEQEVISDDEKNMEATATAIHTAYCKHFIEVGYDTFRDSWRRATELAQKCNADPEGFVAAQKDRSPDLDPEDLETDDSVNAYLKFDKERAQELIFGFNYSERELNSIQQRNLTPAQAEFMFMHASLQPTYMVFQAKAVCSEEQFLKFVKIYGEEAAAEIRSSKLFRQLLQAKYPQIDMDSFLDELDRESEAFRASSNDQQEGSW